MNMPDLVIQALALTIRYLKQFGLERVLGLGASFRPFSSNFEMTLSANALQQLEVLTPLFKKVLVEVSMKFENVWVDFFNFQLPLLFFLFWSTNC